MQVQIVHHLLNTFILLLGLLRKIEPLCNPLHNPRDWFIQSEIAVSSLHYNLIWNNLWETFFMKDRCIKYMYGILYTYYTTHTIRFLFLYIEYICSNIIKHYVIACQLEYFTIKSSIHNRRAMCQQYKKNNA